MAEETRNPSTAQADGYEIGTFHFLHAGWWITHIIGIIAIFYAGWFFGSSY